MNLEKLISIALFVPMPEGLGLPCLLEGPPGIGKSSRIRTAASARGLPFRVVNLPSKQPEDLTGLPVPNGKGGVTWECGLAAVRDLNAKQRGILLFDDTNWAPRAVQASLLSVVLDRQIADIRIHENIRIFLAANSIEEGGGGHSVLTTLGNRVAHLRVEVPTVEEYVAYRQKRVVLERLDVDAGEKRVRDAWPRVYPKHEALHCGFLQSRPELLHMQPKSGSPDRGKAWPSPRSWDAAVRAAATCEALGEGDATFDLVRAIVGVGAGDEYEAYVTARDLPTPEDVLYGRWHPTPERLDICSGAYAGMISLALERADSDTLTHAWTRLAEACDAQLIDIACAQASVLTSKNYGTKCRDKAVVAAAKRTLTRLEQVGASEARL